METSATPGWAQNWRVRQSRECPKLVWLLWASFDLNPSEKGTLSKINMEPAQRLLEDCLRGPLCRFHVSSLLQKLTDSDFLSATTETFRPGEQGYDTSGDGGENPSHHPRNPGFGYDSRTTQRSGFPFSFHGAMCGCCDQSGHFWIDTLTTYTSRRGLPTHQKSPLSCGLGGAQ